MRVGRRNLELHQLLTKARFNLLGCRLLLDGLLVLKSHVFPRFEVLLQLFGIALLHFLHSSSVRFLYALHFFAILGMRVGRRNLEPRQLLTKARFSLFGRRLHFLNLCLQLFDRQRIIIAHLLHLILKLCLLTEFLFFHLRLDKLKLR